MRLEKMPNLKRKIEEEVNKLLADADIEKIDWTVQVDIGERKVVVEIIPAFKDVTDGSKFGVTGVKGSDSLPKIIIPKTQELDETKYPNLS